MLNDGVLSNLENQIDFPVCSFTAIVSVSNEERMVQVPHMSPIGQKKSEGPALRVTHRFRDTRDNRTWSRKGNLYPIFSSVPVRSYLQAAWYSQPCVQVRECPMSRFWPGTIYAKEEVQQLANSSATNRINFAPIIYW